MGLSVEPSDFTSIKCHSHFRVASPIRFANKSQQEESVIVFGEKIIVAANISVQLPMFCLKLQTPATLNAGGSK